MIQFVAGVATMLAGQSVMQYFPVMARQVTRPDSDLIKPTREGVWRVATTRVSVDSSWVGGVRE